MRPVAACALALLLILPAPAMARDTLPWKDANPVGRAGERTKAKPAKRRTEAAKAAAPVAAATAAAAGAASTAAAGDASEVPVPEARPAAPSDPAPAAEPLAPPVPAEAAKPEARPADAPAELAETPAQAPDKAPDAPATSAAEKPLNEIPVPDERPAPTPAEAAPAPAAAAPPPPPVAPVPAPETSPPPPAPKAEEAPNSTEKLKSRELDVTPAATVEAAAAVEDSIACEAELKSRGAEFTVDETISEGECGVLRPVSLKRLSSGVAVSPKTQMLCRTALALDDWMTRSVVPAAKADLPGESLTEFRHASTYVCRPRASESGISEHARGSAIDIGGFVFKSGREIGIAAKEPNTPDETFLQTVRTGACGPFKTVLGPGTDADHATHFHLDIAARKNGATYCK
ncbi:MULTISPECIES: extensin family protein [unclassified Aureimonas]|uniref:extensin-like domain-containing protein n=1 Tax=unclassified Aureimonas TaxID=2615206 RepID=UPI0006FB298C|nr:MULTISPECIES: extensin family protein [unclassified Aureimonas]KQT54026.1 hypothetical protein ASG62_12470 [Aureimonas sp. Leaf427]KQT71534.1 hypothetical protein ASG54_18690 [Aureimonas sp. Leaf460]